MCSADPFTNYEKTVRERIRNGLYPKDLISYEKILKSVETYTDPSKSLPEAKTIISMAFCYYKVSPLISQNKASPTVFLARAYQKDVYGEMYRRAQKFADFLCKKKG